jgi:ATPase subunit of ABC transporter with duplicated ATPase domains
MGKKTAEAQGKNEYMRVYRQLKQAGESAEERETRLAKRREAWQERTSEVKGKRKEYKRVYNLDKMQNETEEEGTNRKQDQAIETVDERARILEILRALFHTASSNDNDQESNEQLSMSVDPTVDIYVPEADEDSESVHEAGGAEVSRNEYLHEGGWQNIDNSSSVL